MRLYYFYVFHLKYWSHLQSVASENFMLNTIDFIIVTEIWPIEIPDNYFLNIFVCVFLVEGTLILVVKVELYA